MNATSRPPVIPQKLLWLSLATLALIATVLRTLSLFLCMDEIGYFQKSALPVALFYAMIALAALLCLSFFFIINKEDVASEPTPLPTARFVGAALAAAALAATALFLILQGNALPTPTVLNLLTALSLVCGTAYFALRLTHVTSTTVALFGYGAILSTALSLILTYFDRYTQMNAPHKLSFHICMILAMLALLFELRELLDRPLPLCTLAFTGFAAAFCTATALPNLLAFAGGVYSDPFYLFFDVMTLGLAAYFCTKCAHYALTPASTPSKEVEE